MKTVIEMAREAAAVHGHTFKAVPSPETIEFITAFAKLVRADEREACAKVCDEVLSTMFPARVSDCAAAIRARGQDPMPLFDDWPGGFK
jgi:hypothetical protein